jgi:riboflavin biosynthesis pyrimidine reductase
MKEKLHVDTLLLEGGGLLNGSVMSMDLIDEISLLMTPTIVNQTNAPSVFERQQEEPLNLRLYSLLDVQKMEKDTVWLRYKKSNQ